MIKQNKKHDQNKQIINLKKKKKNKKKINIVQYKYCT